MLEDPEIVAIMDNARVIELYGLESTPLAMSLRKRFPSARITVTLPDVATDRSTTPPGVASRKFARAERRASGVADTVITFSPEARSRLAEVNNATVIFPPFMARSAASFDPSAAHQRAENHYPVPADERFDDVDSWIRHRFGWKQFKRRVHAVYGPDVSCDAGESPTHREPTFALSVVIPVYNGEHGLSDQLDSLAMQPEADELDVVIADNGSTDRSATVAQAYANAFGAFRVVDASAARGPSHARNIGALMARGRDILFVDADDELRMGYVSAMRSALERHVLVGSVPLLSMPGEAPPPIPKEPKSLRPGPFWFPEYALGGALGVRRETMLEAGGFDESFRGHEEVDFCGRIQQLGYEMVGVPTAVYDYRQRSTLRDAFRQYQHYGHTSIQLWVKHHEEIELQSISLRSTVRPMVRAALRTISSTDRISLEQNIRGVGWMLGTVGGHLRYRVFGSIPNSKLINNFKSVDE
ncbi:glycosyltransferase family 2 protein [Gulosibacter molinativorax]|uniref:glycosyltransferase family 2 protein n=1 Tax=Gulosibacter molinativorax TaxID=256821 RepID=UPI00146AE121|nr:glycosyltransferase [Gulosibacter molinativorax]